jgi:hypothetical protein
MTSQATSTEPWRTAHVAPEIAGVDGLTRLVDATAVLRRYQRNGPHATTTMPMPTPGRVGDDMTKRWSATRADLGHLGATEAALAHLDRAVEHLAPCGYDVLLTADDSDAAYCWLTGPTAPMSMRVGPRPALVRALAEVGRRPRVVAAAVDRIGADLFVIDHAELETGGSADGEQERIHKSSGDGHDQARNQRHSELVWSRNARQTADLIVALAQERHASHVLLTGDQRAVDLVHSHVNGRDNLTVGAVRAGGRHEPDTGFRLLAAAMATAEQAQRSANESDLAWLDEELGQDDRAVDGHVRTLEAAAAGKVKTLIVDVGRSPELPHIDDVIVAAAATGATVQAMAAPHLRDGVAGLLRRPNHAEVSS